MREVKTAQLVHYASPYYDPVKAHEYYMRTRQLKGRQRSTAYLNEEGKKVWAFTKENINTEKKSKAEAAQVARKKKSEALRSRAKALSLALSTQLINFKKNLTNRLKEDRDSLAAKRDAQIAQIRNTPIPKGISKEKKAELLAERREKIAKLRGEYKSESDKASYKTKSGQEAFHEEYTAKKEKVRSELKTAIEAAREAYKAAKSELDFSYEEIYQREYDRIASEYKKVDRPRATKEKKNKSGKT